MDEVIARYTRVPEDDRLRSVRHRSM